MFKSYSLELGGRTLTLEFGKYAEQAAGSTFVRYGETVVLVNATVSETIRPGIDFFPLNVDFEEKLYSVGHIPPCRQCKALCPPGCRARLRSRCRSCRLRSN